MARHARDAPSAEPAAAHDRAAVGGADRQRVRAPRAFVVSRDRDRSVPVWCCAPYAFGGGAGAPLAGGGAAGFACFGFFAFLGFVSPMVALPSGTAVYPARR